MAKYGKYELPTDDKKALGQDIRYRVRSINSSNRESPAVGNTSIKFLTSGKPSSVRIRSNTSDFVTQQGANVDGSLYRIRIKSVSNNIESPWVESSVGTISFREGI